MGKYLGPQRPKPSASTLLHFSTVQTIRERRIGKLKPSSGVHELIRESQAVKGGSRTKEASTCRFLVAYTQARHGLNPCPRRRYARDEPPSGVWVNQIDTWNRTSSNEDPPQTHLRSSRGAWTRRSNPNACRGCGDVALLVPIRQHAVAECQSIASIGAQVPDVSLQLGS